MGKPTVQQIAGLDIVDWLYFNQTLVRAVMDHDELAWFIMIVERVKSAVAATGTAGTEAEIMKHYVLCFLEIFASDDHPEDAKVAELHQHNKKFFCAMLIAISEKARNHSLTEALGIATALVDDVLSAPAVVRVRLAERCFAAEYETAAHEGFMWLVKAKAIPCAKYRDADVRPHPSHEAVVARIGLLCEFECEKFHFRMVQKARALPSLRFREIANNLSMSDKQLVLEAGELWIDHHFRGVPSGFPVFYVDRQSDKDFVLNFLQQVHLNWTRQRFCLGTLAGWVSNLGALTIMVSKSIGDRRPIYIEENRNSSDTLAEDAKNTMLRYGMTIHARSLYMRYREFTTTMLPRIEVYCEAIKAGPGVLSAEEEDPFYRAMLAFPWNAADAKEAQERWLRISEQLFK